MTLFVWQLEFRPVIMLSTFDNPTYIARSLALGARDYVLKESPREEIVDAISLRYAGPVPPEPGPPALYNGPVR